jgi:hypothetical protein
MYCSGCGLKVKTGIAKYCSGCGAALPENTRPAGKPGSAFTNIADALRKSGALHDGGLLGTNQPSVPLTKAQKRTAIIVVTIMILLAAGMFFANSRT